MRATKRTAIVAAAARLIRQRGVHGASIADIIEQAGTSAGTIYHHFANKHDIVLAVARAAISVPLAAAFERHAGRSLSPGDLLAAVVSVARTDVESALIVQLWAGSAEDPALAALLRDEMAVVRTGMVDRLSAWLAEQGIDDPDGSAALQLAQMTMGVAMGLLAQRLLLGDVDQAAHLEAASRVLEAGAYAIRPTSTPV